ncbi:MAG TPA: hypothetical protein VFZ34_07385 [Blastocatellia bacterium]|nr:hypothetical protein [Blastocatellia bacterium]
MPLTFRLSPAPPLPLPPSLTRPVALSPARRLAEACGIPIKYETLPLAFGRVVYLAEASLQPAGITINQTAITKLVEAALQIPIEQRVWWTEAAITEVVIAHELYHILKQQPSSKAAETAAHEFAQALTGLPFSPRVYEAFLKQAAGCRITKNII